MFNAYTHRCSGTTRKLWNICLDLSNLYLLRNVVKNFVQGPFKTISFVTKQHFTIKKKEKDDNQFIIFGFHCSKKINH